MRNNLLTISFISVSTLVTILPANKLSAESHELEISLQNCYFAKTFAKTVMEKRKESRPMSYYEQINFTSPVAIEIVLDAYDVGQKEPNFSDEWFKKCLEFSCSGFWADLKIALDLVSDQKN